jgi:hypothetical protein
VETGQLFLMVKKIKLIQHNQLSIHAFVNGFSFCTQSKVDFLPTSSVVSDGKSLFEEFINYYPKNSFKAISVVHFSHPSTFVPLALFDVSQKKRYLSHYKIAAKNDVFHHDTLEKSTKVNIYSYPKEIETILETSANNFQEIHYNSLLYNLVHELSLRTEKKSQLFLHLQKEKVDVFLIKNGRLLFNNSFSIKNEDEFLYYVFFVVEQFELESNVFELIFLGKIDLFNSYYEAVKHYHENIFFHQEEIISSQAIKNHNAPFLSQFFN